MNRAQRSRSLLILLLAGALPLSALGCRARPHNAEPKEDPAAALVATGVKVEPRTTVTTSSYSKSVTSVTRDGKTSTEVTVRVDSHPEIERSFDFPVEVTINKVTVDAVERTDVVIKKKTGELVESVRL